MSGTSAAVLDFVAWMWGVTRPSQHLWSGFARGKLLISLTAIICGFLSRAVSFLSNTSPYRSKQDRSRQERGPRGSFSPPSALREGRPRGQCTSAPLGGSEGGRRET